jgi:hypothetical protein
MQCLYQAAKALKNGAFGALFPFSFQFFTRLAAVFAEEVAHQRDPQGVNY